MKKRFRSICCILLSAVFISGCNQVKYPDQGAVDIGNTANQNTVEAILAEAQNKVITVGNEDGAFRLTGVSEDVSSCHVANEKFELNLQSTITGLNVYDPSDVDIYGQFVSPSGKLYEMPAFWYENFNRTFEEYDLTKNYDMVGGNFFAQGNCELYGVIDQKDGKKQPVAKISFNNTNVAQSANAGAVISTGGVAMGYDMVSIWLKADENLQADGLYLYFYTADDQAYVKLPALTTTWTQYTFKYGGEVTTAEKRDKNGNLILDSEGNTQTVEILTNVSETDFTHNNTYNPLPLNRMYSVRIQCNNGIPVGQAGADRYTAVGDVYMSEARCYWSLLEGKSTSLSDFIAKPLKTYIEGDLFGKETIESVGTGNFKIRFRFPETGQWTYRIVGEKNGEKKFSYTSTVTATANPDTEKNKGLIRVEPTQKRNFVFEDGTPYMPIGINVCYSQDIQLGSTLFDIYYPKMKAAGMNFVRTWLTDIDAAYGAQGAEGGILNFDARQNKSFQFDRVVKLAEENGLYLQIPMQAISAFRKDVDSGLYSHRWDTNPYNKLNGGYLDEPWEYFTDSRAIEDTKKLYRYYVARYGYSRNILNWELMNEIGMDSSWYYGVQITQEQARDWAEEIGSYMHSIDPFDHLVSISSGNDHSDKVYEAEAMDFVSFHWYYGGSNYAITLANECYAVWQRFGKPAMIGEGGASGTSEAYEHDKDPAGSWGKQTAFTCGMGGGAAGAMNFWEETVNKYNKYGNYTPAANMYKLFGSEYVTLDTLLAERYTIEGVEASKVQMFGYIGNDSVYAYITNTQYNYSNQNPSAISGMSIEFNGLSDGTFTVQVYDTQAGAVSNTYSMISENGKLRLSLEAWSCDVALIINKV